MGIQLSAEQEHTILYKHRYIIGLTSTDITSHIQTLSKSTNYQAINSLVKTLLDYINYGLNYIEYITYSVYVCTYVF